MKLKKLLTVISTGVIIFCCSCSEKSKKQEKDMSFAESPEIMVCRVIDAIASDDEAAYNNCCSGIENSIISRLMTYMKNTPCSAVNSVLIMKQSAALKILMCTYTTISGIPKVSFHSSYILKILNLLNSISKLSMT